LQLQRLPDGRRRLISIDEITGMQNDAIEIHGIFRYVKEETDAQGNVVGYFTATGRRPQFLQALLPYGIQLPPTHFDPGRRM